MVNVPENTTVNATEFVPAVDSIAFAPELIDFISNNQKLSTYRYGMKYDHFKVGDTIKYQNSETGEIVGKLLITSKNETSFGDLSLGNPAHEAYRDKDQQRAVLSGYYAYIGRTIADNDPFLVFEFELAEQS